MTNDEAMLDFLSRFEQTSVQDTVPSNNNNGSTSSAHTIYSVVKFKGDLSRELEILKERIDRNKSTLKSGSSGGGQA